MTTSEDVESLASHAYVSILHEGVKQLEAEIERQRAIRRRLVEEILEAEATISA